LPDGKKTPQKILWLIPGILTSSMKNGFEMAGKHSDILKNFTSFYPIDNFKE